ncbi:MAG: hypothetical protein E6I22_02595 [Chloroflexi bacterium]|nr:MAG: hypothetical protein E6I22_02595 [Chloroflexota bacterium]
MRITGLETRSYRYPLDPPFRAAWDPLPRDHAEETLALVHSDEGLTGVAGGAPLPDRAQLERLLKGVDPFRTELVREICETVDFHGGRPWTVEVAVWDLVGRALNTPLWLLLGGRSDRLHAYASSGERVEPDERVKRVLALRDAGIRAVKIRFDHRDWGGDLEVVQQVRRAVGSEFQIMVDVNQGWRMAGDLRQPWDVPTAVACARALERCDVYWLEEPLPSHDVDGYARLRSRVSIRLAAGEMVRSPSTLCSRTPCWRAASGAAGGSLPWQTCAAGHSLHTPGRPAWAWSRTFTSRVRCPPRNSSKYPSTRPPGAASGGTGCCRHRLPSIATALSAHRQGQAWECQWTSRRWNATAWHERSPAYEGSRAPRIRHTVARGGGAFGPAPCGGGPGPGGSRRRLSLRPSAG